MSQDVPLLERLGQLSPVPVAHILALVDRMERPDQDPLLARLVGVNDQDERAVHPLLVPLLEHVQRDPELTCYQALLEGLTGIWNAAVRAAVVARLRAAGLPPDDLLLRLQALSPTLGFAGERPEWAREWLADPPTQDGVLIDQCLARLLLAMRGMAEARAAALAEAGAGPSG